MTHVWNSAVELPTTGTTSIVTCAKFGEREWAAQLSNPLMLRTHFPIHLKARNPTQSSGFKKDMDLESSYAHRNFSMEAKHFPEISLLCPQIKFLLVGRSVVAANKTATSHDDSEWHAVLRGNSSD